MPRPVRFAAFACAIAFAGCGLAPDGDDGIRTLGAVEQHQGQSVTCDAVGAAIVPGVPIPWDEHLLRFGGGGTDDAGGGSPGSTLYIPNADAYRDVMDQFQVECSLRYLARVSVSSRVPCTSANCASYCNIYLWDTSRALGHPIPHWIGRTDGLPIDSLDEDLGVNIMAGRGREMQINETVRWMIRHEGDLRYHDWIRITTPALLQQGPDHADFCAWGSSERAQAQWYQTPRIDDARSPGQLAQALANYGVPVAAMWMNGHVRRDGALVPDHDCTDDNGVGHIAWVVPTRAPFDPSRGPAISQAGGYHRNFGVGQRDPSAAAADADLPVADGGIESSYPQSFAAEGFFVGDSYLLAELRYYIPAAYRGWLNPALPD